MSPLQTVQPSHVLPLRAARKTRGVGPRIAAWTLLVSLGAAACGDGGGGTSPAAAPGELMVSPQNSALLVGVDRLSLALLDAQQRPVSAAKAMLEIQGARGTFETLPLENIGPEYGNIPIYVGTARFPQAGQFKFVVNAVLANGSKQSGQAFIDVKAASPELAVGTAAPAISQPILTDPGVKISDIDSGVPPDEWHGTTIAAGLAQHKPMILYFGEPAYCKSKTCGPTVQILQKLNAEYGDRFIFEHIETHFPAGPDEGGKDNPAFKAFNLETDPWVFFVNSAGMISDRFEGPVTVSELKSAADGTLHGHVPAVDIALAK